jgi:hypothetical protein
MFFRVYTGVCKGFCGEWMNFVTKNIKYFDDCLLQVVAIYVKACPLEQKLLLLLNESFQYQREYLYEG